MLSKFGFSTFKQFKKHCRLILNISQTRMKCFSSSINQSLQYLHFLSWIRVTGQVYSTLVLFAMCAQNSCTGWSILTVISNHTLKTEKIFIRFYVVVNYYLLSLSFKFHGDPCTNARARVIHARTHDKMCARVYTSCARICAWIFAKFQT